MPPRCFKRIWHKLARLDARPDQIAAGFSIGIFASFLPLNPSPIFTAAAAAWLLKRNVIAAVAGGTAAIFYTPLLPLLWLAEYRLGKRILPVQHPPVWDVCAAMFVGSILIAVPVTLLVYGVVKRLAGGWARQREAFPGQKNEGFP